VSRREPWSGGSCSDNHQQHTSNQVQVEAEPVVRRDWRIDVPVELRHPRVEVHDFEVANANDCDSGGRSPEREPAVVEQAHPDQSEHRGDETVATLNSGANRVPE
jgi:hypothetical protein